MPAPQLADYEAAFDHTARQLQHERDDRHFGVLVRRRLRQPQWELIRTLLIMVVCAASSLVGVSNGWMVALGLGLADLPGRMARSRRQRHALTEVQSGEDVRALVERQAGLKMAGAFTTSLFLSILGFLYLAVSVVAWLKDKSPWPGLIAGLVVLAWGAYQFLVVFPRAARESRAFSALAADAEGPETSDRD
jgi:hypothetical protein